MGLWWNVSHPLWLPLVASGWCLPSLATGSTLSSSSPKCTRARIPTKACGVPCYESFHFELIFSSGQGLGSLKKDTFWVLLFCVWDIPSLDLLWTKTCSCYSCLQHYRSTRRFAHDDHQDHWQRYAPCRQAICCNLEVNTGDFPNRWMHKHTYKMDSRVQRCDISTSLWKLVYFTSLKYVLFFVR